MSSLIKLENITKVYQTTDQPYHALRGISLNIMQGEMVAIVGASGSGKSTLMHIVGLLDRPSSGHYQFSGEDIAHLSDLELAGIRNRKIGFVFQSFYLLPRLNALHNVMLPLYYRGVPDDEAELRAYHMLEKMEVKQVAMHRPSQLSGGQQQRVAIARALVGDPELILADEPTGALDSRMGQEVMSLFLQLHHEGSHSIVIVTHDHKVSEQCQRVITLRDGWVAQ